MQSRHARSWWLQPAKVVVKGWSRTPTRSVTEEGRLPERLLTSSHEPKASKNKGKYTNNKRNKLSKCQALVRAQDPYTESMKVCSIADHHSMTEMKYTDFFRLRLPVHRFPFSSAYGIQMPARACSKRPPVSARRTQSWFRGFTGGSSNLRQLLGV